MANQSPLQNLIIRTMEICIGEGKPYANHAAFISTLKGMAASKAEKDISVARLLNPEKGLTANEAILMSVALFMSSRESGFFMSYARNAYAANHTEEALQTAWEKVASRISDRSLEAQRNALISGRVETTELENLLHVADPVPVAPEPIVPKPAAPEPIAPTSITPVTPRPITPALTAAQLVRRQVKLEGVKVIDSDAPPHVRRKQRREILQSLAGEATPPASKLPKPPKVKAEKPPKPVKPPKEKKIKPPKVKVEKPKIEKPKPEKITPVAALIEPVITPPIESVVEEKKEAHGPFVSQEDIHSYVEKRAIAHARERFAAMEIYNKETVAEITTDLLLDLLETPLHSHLGPLALSEGTGSKVGVDIFSRIFSGAKINPESFAATGAADTLAKTIVLDPAHRKEVANYLAGIPLPPSENMAGDIVNYTVSHQLETSEMMRLLRYERRASPGAFSEQIGIKLDAFNRLSHGKCNRVFNGSDPIALTSNFLKLGKKDALTFRKIILDIPQEATQEMLNQCFDNSLYHVDQEAQGRDRTIALSRFFELLRMVHGKRDFCELAQAITTHVGLGEAVAGELQHRMLNLGGNGGFDEESEKKMSEKRGKIMDANLAKSVAQFAFPEDEAMQARGIEFLSSEKKYHLSRSEVLARAWVTRKNKSQGNERGVV